MRALLFDIDGTLTKSGGAGTRALGNALGTKQRAFDELKKMRLDGMTDRAIVRLLLAAEHGDPAVPITERTAQVREPDIDALLVQYLEALAKECAAQSYVPMPGVPALLRALQARSDVLLGLCTGNISRGAELKLSSAGLWGPFKFGGFGSDAEPRADIVRTAWRRALELGATSAIVIGDTPRDVLAAHDAGLPACGVATGRWTVQQLAQNGADAVLESFADLDATLAVLMNS
jgi:phosphoglycolate phosphatase-like HAD superfamily hydrolase